MQALTIESAHTDLRLASGAYEKIANLNDCCMINQVAYHSGQAIEKLLKDIVLKYCSSDVYRELYDKHNIEEIITRIEEKVPGFMASHKFITENADELSKFNNLRYGKKYMEKSDALYVLKQAKVFFKEMEAEYLAEYPNVRQNHEFAARTLREQGKISIKRVEEERGD